MAIKSRVEKEGQFLRGMAREYGSAAVRYATEETKLTGAKSTILSNYQEAVTAVYDEYDNQIAEQVKAKEDLDVQYAESVKRSKEIEAAKNAKLEEIKDTPEYQKYLADRIAIDAELKEFHKRVTAGEYIGHIVYDVEFLGGTEALAVADYRRAVNFFQLIADAHDKRP